MRIWIGIGLLIWGGGIVKTQEALEYEVKGDAQVIPLFAVDKKGRPIADLMEGKN